MTMACPRQVEAIARRSPGRGGQPSGRRQRPEPQQHAVNGSITQGRYARQSSCRYQNVAVTRSKTATLSVVLSSSWLPV